MCFSVQSKSSDKRKMQSARWIVVVVPLSVSIARLANQEQHNECPMGR